jgi:hypothetical protein
MRVGQSCPLLVEEAAQIAAVGSSSLLAMPLLEGANHHLGLTMGGLIHNAEWPAGLEGTGRVMTFRHPNAVYALAYVWIVSSAQEASTVELTAGTGATVTRTVGRGDAGLWIAAPWGGSGWQEIVYQSSDCDMGLVSIWSLQRSTLAPGTDMAADRLNTDHPGAGLDAEHYIVHDAADFDLSGVATAIEEARKHGVRQAVAWTKLGGTVQTVGAAGAWNNPLAPLTWAHGCRSTLGGSTRTYRAAARSMKTGGTWYKWRVTSASGGSVATGNLVNAAMAWDYVDGLTIDADDVLTFEWWGNAGPTLDLGSVSVAEIPA